MKQLKNAGNNAGRYGRTPYKRSKPQNENSQKCTQDPVEVYCRLRPLINSQDEMCITLQSAGTVTLNPPDSSKNRKVLQYGFKHVFTEHTTQKEIFDTVALPLLEGLLHGKNGLLFTYGVTGSGKTYTMTGDPNDSGLMPRCINTLFNTIQDHQTPKFLIKSDKMNGFEVQMPADALNERLKEAKSKSKITVKHKGSTEALTNFSNDGVDLNSIQENCLFSVYVNYIEIYNNTVYDLLDDLIGNKLQPKILREDWNHGMYVNGVVELEVKSAEEAFELFSIGQKRKRTAHTVMNTESSRSHSIFTIRLVQGLFDSTGEQISKIGESLIVSQLSLVDLAGSERCSRTQTTGQRLKEAGSINNSLMSLRTCLEILRENQMQATNKIVPYRDSRLTLLFKNYFDGEGKVEMIVCVNPSANDYDETLQVMKFAEITQEVKVARAESKEHILQELIIKNKAEKEKIVKKRKSEEALEEQYKEFKKMPPFKLVDNSTDEQNLDALYKYLKLRVEKRGVRRAVQIKERDAFRQRILHLYKNNLLLKTEIRDLKSIVKKRHEVSKKIEDEKLHMEIALDNLVKESEKKDSIIEELHNTVKEKSFKLNQNILTSEEEKRRMEEKLLHDHDAKLRYERDLLTAQMKERADKIELVKDILNNEPVLPRSDIQSIKNSLFKKSLETPTPTKSQEIQVDNHVRHSSRTPRGVPVANPRYRRSRSTGDVWLEHRPVHPVPLGTVLQPHIKRRKSVTKLTSVKDITNNKQCKYLLIDQGEDEVGDLETKLYKGDIIPTCTGGAQIVFDDVEKLKQESPTAETPKLRSTFKRNYFGTNGEDSKFKLCHGPDIPSLSSGDNTLTIQCIRTYMVG